MPVGYPGKPENSVRVATLNMSCSSEAVEERLTSTALWIEMLGFDAVALQEVQHYQDSNAAYVLAEKLGWNAVCYMPDILEGHAAWHGNAVITKNVLHATETHILPGEPFPGVTASCSLIIAHTELQGYPWLVASTHLSWGGRAEPMRVQQVQTIDRIVTELVEPDRFGNSGTPVVLGGDFNATPGSDMYRWITGMSVENGLSTYWTDAWEHALHHTNGTVEGYTQVPENDWTAISAKVVGIRNRELMLRRRIDYLMSFGYCHGRPGTPLNAGIWGDTTEYGLLPSDHYGVWADLAAF